MERGPGRKICYPFAAAALLFSAALVLALGSVASAGEAPDRQFSPQYGYGTVHLAALDGDATSGEHTAAQVAETASGTQGTGSRLVDWALATFVDGASVTMGVGVRRSSFIITRKSDHATGMIMDRDYPAVFVVYSTKPTFFTESQAGYTFMLRLSSFNMDQTIASGVPVGGAPTDVRSNIQGVIGYALPALFYQWGEHRKTGTFFQIGAGVGLTTTTYSGTIELQTATGTESVGVRDQSFSLNLAWGAFLEARWRHGGIYLSLMRSQMPGETYDTTFEDVSLYFGYQLLF
jgi:hypothetical protein